jgi:hypothetical protein
MPAAHLLPTYPAVVRQSADTSTGTEGVMTAKGDHSTLVQTATYREVGGGRRLLQQSTLNRIADNLCGNTFPGARFFPGAWNNNNATLCRTRVQEFVQKMVRVGRQRRGVRACLPAASEVAQAHHAAPCAASAARRLWRQ